MLAIYPVSQDYIDKINSGSFNEGDEQISGTMTLIDGDIINITADDIEMGSLSISADMLDGSDFSIGSARLYELNMILLEYDGNVKSLEGAEVKLKYSLAGQDIPLCKFYIDGKSISRQRNAVSLTGYNSMIRFDKYIEDVDEAINLENRTAYSLLQFCCTGSGVPLFNTQSEIQAMPNGYRFYTVSSEVETLRDIINCICCALGAFARISRNDELEIVPITGVQGYIRSIPANIRSGTTYSDAQMEINSVMSYSAGRRLGLKRSGAEKIFRLIIPQNPIVNINKKDDFAEFLREIYNSLSKVQYVPFETNFVGDIALDCGDYIQLTDGEIDNDSGRIVGLLTSFNWTFRGEHKLKSVGGLGDSPAKPVSQSQSLSNNIPSGGSAFDTGPHDGIIRGIQNGQWVPIPAGEALLKSAPLIYTTMTLEGDNGGL